MDVNASATIPLSIQNPSVVDQLGQQIPEPIPDIQPTLNDGSDTPALENVPAAATTCVPPAKPAECPKDIEAKGADADGEGSEGEEGYEDGVPEDLAEYMEDIWEHLMGASESEDWDHALKLWAKLEKRMGYPEGRVSTMFSTLN